MFNEARNRNETVEKEDLLETVACAWLNHECDSHGLDHFGLKKPWYQNFPVNLRNYFYIGRLTHAFHFHEYSWTKNFSLKQYFN